MKACSKCKTERELSMYSKDNRRADKLNVQCKVCIAARHQTRRQRYIEQNKPPESKVCNACKTNKPASDFYKATGTKTQLASECKACQQERSRIYVDRNRVTVNEKCRVYHKENAVLIRTKAWARAVRRKYGITVEELEAKKAAQNYRCDICLRPESELKIALNMDHCHATGKLRKLLCNSCNTGLGSFKDSEELLAKAIDYIKTHKGTV